jgi:hypothetical protein
VRYNNIRRRVWRLQGEGKDMIRSVSRWTVAWFLACLVFALHIVDEGAHGTFGFYSDLERLLTELLPSLNITPFNFELWLVNMSGTLIVLFLLTPLVWAASPIMVPASYAFAAFLSGNAAFHLLMTVGRGDAVTGALTSPLMLAAGLFLFLSTGNPRAVTSSQEA